MRLSIPLAALITGLAGPAVAQPRETGSLAEHLAPLEKMHGEWRGTATVYSPEGATTLVHTERVGPMLKGDILIVEGLAYNEGGEPEFNAFGIISYDPHQDAYAIRAYTGGYGATYPLTLTETGYEWSVPAGPDAKVHYVATIEGDEWTETGTYIRGDQEFPTISFTVKRVGETDWPAAGQVAAE